ncbi:hypothetical protein OPQ81_002153 [Rhizoctonia solani]|nr:hypothetical protein OPQ81_002153 [Rhizoctonia solani]
MLCNLWLVAATTSSNRLIATCALCHEPNQVYESTVPTADVRFLSNTLVYTTEVSRLWRQRQLHILPLHLSVRAV